MSRVTPAKLSTIEVKTEELKDFAANDDPLISSFTVEGLAPLLSREPFTQDQNRLREYSVMVAKNPTVRQALVDIVLASRTIHEDPEADRATTTAASNAISVLNYGSRSGVFPFHFIDVRDWSGIRVPGANLNYAIMAHCNFNDADFSYSSMINVTLICAQLNRVNLSGVKNYALTELELWPDAKTGRGPSTLAVHPRGGMAAVESSDGVIRLFNNETKDDICQLSGHTALVEFLSFSCDGHLASVSADKTVRVWNLATYQCMSVFELPPSATAPLSPVTFSPDNTCIAIACDCGVIGVGNIKTSEWSTTFKHDNAHDVDWSPCGSRILSYTGDGNMCIWDVATSSCVVRWHIRYTRDCLGRFTRDGSKVVVRTQNLISLFDSRSGDSVGKLQWQFRDLPVFTLDQNYIYVTAHPWICVFDPRSYGCIAKFPTDSKVSKLFPTLDGQRLFAYSQAACNLLCFDSESLQHIPRLAGTGQSYYSLAFSPDNQYLVATNYGSDGHLTFIDVMTGHTRKTVSIVGDEGGSESYLLSCCPGGRYVAFVTHLNHEIFLYDTSKPTCMTRLTKHATPVACITFDPTGKLLASSAENSDDHHRANGNIVLWDTTTWKSKILRGHTQLVHTMCFSPDGNMLASASEDMTLRIWNVVTDKCTMVLGDQPTYSSCLSYSPCGRFLASTENRRDIRIWNATNGHCISTFSKSSGVIDGDIRFLRNGRLILINHTYQILDIFTGEYFDLGLKSASGIQVVSQDSSLMATRLSAETKNALYLWRFQSDAWKSKIVCENVGILGAPTSNLQVVNVDLEHGNFLIVSALDSGGSIHIVTPTSIETISSTLQGHADAATCLHARGSCLVSGSQDSTLRLWNLETKQCSAVFEGHASAVSCVQLSPDDRLIASGSQDTTIRLWNVLETKCIGQFEGHTMPVNLIRFSPDSSLLASVGSGSNVVHIWDVASTSCSKILDQHADEIFDLQFSAGGAYLASGSHDNSICVWEMKTGECVATLKGHTDSLTCFVITSDGKTVASGSEDTTIRIWDVTTGECKLTIKGHTGHIRSLCLTPDDRCVISASNDRVIQIWDITTGAMLHQLLGHTDAVISAKLIQYDARGESTIVSCSLDGALRVWTVDKMSSRTTYLPEIYGMIGAQEVVELAGARMKGAIYNDD